jgi:hypothetical protein
MQLDRQAQRARRSNTRAIWAGSKAMPSQNPSTASTSPSAWAASQRGQADLVDIGVGAAMPGGTAWAPRKLVTHPHRARLAHARATRSIFSSVSMSSP